MRGKQYISGSARCPFYKKHDAKCVFCNGYRKIKEIILSFMNTTDRELFMVEFCDHIYERCSIYKALERECEIAEKSRELRRKHE